ncbi:phenylalanine--tRNA ligase subunit beta [Gammaproteobacteria bacterium]|nr:phenylalanine--tRNA ligase subunit beta [Gammaproteobacteria bacterium]
MKIAYKHLVRHIKEYPSMEEVSSSLFQLGHEHELEGNIFNMEFTPNRGDCLSINGLLRDLSVFYEVNFSQKFFDDKINKLEIDFENLSEDICPKISFLKLEIDNTPDKYKCYLNDYFLDLNINKNNFFTDISNYVSYETGQPTHCYDANKINGKLVFQELDINQEFETLHDKKINLTNKNSVFFLDDQIINLAGVVGGKSTSCSSQTKSVLIECAFFKPEAIIGKSVKYDVQSEASHKFERHVDPSCHDMVLRRFIDIVSDHVNIKDMSLVSYEFKQNTVIKIPVDVNKINQIIGTNISEDEYLDHLLKLGFAISDKFIKVPLHRSDIETQNDLAEEIARIIGYDNIPISDLVIPKGHTSNNDDIENKLRYFLLDNGFYEVINSPFVKTYSDSSIEVDNPLDSNKKYLRTNISNSLLDNLIFNERRQKDSIKLFEVSDIYTTSNNKINKTRKLSIVASGRVGHNYEDFSKKINKDYLIKLFKEVLPNENFDFQILSRDALNSKNKNEIIGCEIDIDNFSSEVLKYKEKFKSPTNFNQYSPISDLPYSVRDLSFSIKDFSKCRPLEEYILMYKNDLLKDIYIFDYFHNKKNKEIKIGFRFVFQSAKSTITETEVNNIIGVIINHTQKIKGVTIPGLN